MSIKALSSAVLNLPIISHISSLFGRSYNVIQKNEVAAQEAQSVGILALTGVVFTAAVKSAMMASSGRFSAPGLGLYALIGLGIGTAASSFLIYSFFSNLKKREKGYSENDIGNPQLAQLYLQQQRQLKDPQGLIDPLN